MSTIRPSNDLVPDQDQQYVGPDLGTNCFKGYQQMTKVDASKEKLHVQSGLQIKYVIENLFLISQSKTYDEVLKTRGPEGPEALT